MNEASKLDDLDEMLRDDELMGGMTSDTDNGDGRRPRFIFEDYFGNVQQNWKNILKYKIERSDPGSLKFFLETQRKIRAWYTLTLFCPYVCGTVHIHVSCTTFYMYV